MKLWPGIIKQLSAAEPEVRKGTAWVCGTAVQNNPEAQKAFLDNQGLAPLVQLLKDQDSSVRSKAIYAISCFLKHNPVGVQSFDQLEGLSVLQTLLKQSDDTTALRKIVFLYNSLIFENESVLKRAVENDTMRDLDAILVKYTTKESEDEDMVEKTLRTLHTLITKGGLSVPDELKQHIKAACTQFGLENLALVESEYQELIK
ncbi:armadillo-type protein [Choanephora cucurbitarum]|nr:armadillo-type protein [Choanephora cucurbitarum]